MSSSKSWQLIKVRELCNLVNGNAYKPSDWSSSGIRIIRIQNLNDVSKSFNFWDGEIYNRVVVKDGDVLIAWSGTPGTSFGAHIWNRGKAVLNQHIFRVDFKTNLVSADWFRLAINQSLNILIHRAHGGVGLQHVTRGEVDNLIIPLPPLAEQERIVRLLDEAEALQKLRGQANTRMEEFVPALFHEMFGKPEKLRLVKIGDITQVKTGGTPSRKEPKYFEGNIPWVKTTEVNQSIIFDTEEKISQEAIKNSNCEIFPPETILIAMYGQGVTRGRTGKLGISATTNQACAAILPSREIDTDYLWTLLQMSYEKLRSLGHGGNQPNLNLSMIKCFEVTLPPLDLQREFAQRVQEARGVQSAQARSEERVEALYQSMLSRAFAP